ncbi:MAG: HAMP domain-containing protein [Deltaproteobacteria bacterium]|nr:HAMP domain-containing protein [Deltaproteobacteria bacterium]
MVESPTKKYSDEKDLQKRPIFSFRLLIILGFFTFFILSMMITFAAMIAINGIEKRITTVQTWERFLFNIEQARRWEKNFFLYGTNLSDAVQSVEAARDILDKNFKGLEISSFPPHNKKIFHEFHLYYDDLYDLYRLVNAGSHTPYEEIEDKLRHHGYQIVNGAAELAASEFETVTIWLKLLQRIPAYFLVFLFFLMVFMAWFLSWRFITPLNYLVAQTKRIAKGDFTPVKHMHKYRDEFTNVEVAVNRMLRELESRQKSLIESHKLRAVGILTAGVAHELNNPLNNIMLTAYSLMEEYETMNKMEHMGMIKDIISETDRSKSIVHNLLDFTRESICVLESLDLGKLVEETAKLALNQARVRGLTINVQVGSDLPKIQGDRQQLKQVVLNMLLNSMDALSPGGRIDVRVKKLKPGNLGIQVEDNGCGIPADVIPHIFDPFFTTKPVGKGTGLGLSVSHGIIAKHGGIIEMESVPGQKTVFTITLPYENISAIKK